MNKITKSSGVPPESAAAFAQTLELINPHLYSVEERIREQARAFDPAVEGYVSYVCEKGANGCGRFSPFWLGAHPGELRLATLISR